MEFVEKNQKKAYTHNVNNDLNCHQGKRKTPKIKNN